VSPAIGARRRPDCRDDLRVARTGARAQSEYDRYGARPQHANAVHGSGGHSSRVSFGSHIRTSACPLKPPVLCRAVWWSRRASGRLSSTTPAPTTSGIAGPRSAGPSTDRGHSPSVGHKPRSTSRSVTTSRSTSTTSTLPVRLARRRSVATGHATFRTVTPRGEEGDGGHCRAPRSVPVVLPRESEAVHTTVRLPPCQVPWSGAYQDRS
jgi:hypothetical protein